MTTFTLETPITVGSMSSPISVSSLQVTTIQWTSTPPLAPGGTGTLSVTLTDPKSGFQEQINYTDASVLTLWSTPQSPAAGTELGDVMSQAVFAKLIADGKLPEGSVSVTNPSASPEPTQVPATA